MGTDPSVAAAIEPQRIATPSGGRGARGRPVLCPPEPWEFELLRLLAEQTAIPFDQLARFLDCDERQAATVVKHLTKVGYADYGRFLYDEPHWAWLTGRGTRQSGTGFWPTRPRVGAMARMRAVNEIRLHIARRAPEARWIGPRSIIREQGRTGYRPNAVVEIGAERHALVVLLRAGDQGRMRDIIETHVARYDALVAFANPRPMALLKRLQAENHWPKLVIRPIPGPQ